MAGALLLAALALAPHAAAQPGDPPGAAAPATGPFSPPLALEPPAASARGALGFGGEGVRHAVAPQSVRDPAGGARHEVDPANCYYSIWGDPRDATVLDIQAYGGRYNCTNSTWTFTAITYDTWTTAQLEFFLVGVDSDSDSTTGCGGLERALIAVNQGGSVSASVVRTPSCSSATWTAAGQASGRRIGADGIAIDVANAALGSPSSIFWGSLLKSSASQVSDSAPDTGTHYETGFLGGGCQPFFPNQFYAAVSSPRSAAEALRGAGMPAADHGHGVVAFEGNPERAAGVLAAAGIGAAVRPVTAGSYMATPNDPGFAGQWPMQAVRAPEAWDRSRGSGGVWVADIGSGVDAGHPDLAGKLLPGYDAVRGSALGAGNTDTNDHNTAVAGVIAARTNNSLGLAGLGWDTMVLPVKDGDAEPLRSSTVAGIRFAADRGARIINLSSGFPCRDPNEEAAIAYARSKGALVVASAGNSANDGNRIIYPAAYDGVMAVGATGFDGTIAHYSNFGGYVVMTAPGGSGDGNPAHEVPVLTAGGGSGLKAGTSFSAPMVAATAALILAHRPELKAGDLFNILITTARDAGEPGRDSLYGYGVLDTAAAVIAAGIPVGGIAAPAPPPAGGLRAAGYRLAAADGGIFAFGQAPFFGSAGGTRLNRPIKGVAGSPTGAGYWLVAEDGGIFAYGDARFFGSTGAIRLARPIVGMAPTPTGRGYWLVAEDGGIFAFGDAGFFGSTGAIRLARPIVGMAPTPTGRGYWLAASDGGVFSFGDARFFGSAGAMRLNQPIVSIAATPTGAGYWLVGADGGIFAYGDARFFGSTGAIRLNRPIVSMAPTPSGAGYWLVASDGGIFAYGDAVFYGSTGGTRLNQPIIGLAPVRG